ncbi:MAG: hypothetical protein LBD55_08480 [Treponema sp.]|nr:hypothetical protein [Treponema sp.]
MRSKLQSVSGIPSQSPVLTFSLAMAGRFSMDPGPECASACPFRPSDDGVLTADDGLSVPVLS